MDLARLQDDFYDFSGFHLHYKKMNARVGLIFDTQKA